VAREAANGGAAAANAAADAGDAAAAFAPLA